MTAVLDHDLEGADKPVIPTTIYGLIDTRRLLPAMLRAFRVSGGVGAFVFGRHHRPEAVILPWQLFEHLVDAADTLAAAAQVAELDRRRRHPAGPSTVTIAGLAALLDTPVPPAAGPADPETDPEGERLVAWPTLLDDLMKLAEQEPPTARATLATALADIARDRRAGTPLATLPGQPHLEGHRHLLVTLDTDRGTAVTVTFTAPAPAKIPPAVELLAVLPAGPLQVALAQLDSTTVLDPTQEGDG